MTNLLHTLTANAALITFIFITLDVVSGLMKGAAQSNLSSKIMRQGFWHKGSLFLVIVLAAAIDTAISSGLNIGFNAPIFEGTCIYIIGMETVSILENVVEMNPELKDSKLFALFRKNNDKEVE